MEEEIKVDLPKEPNSPSNKKKHEPTLDEPILDTIKRDVRRVGIKLVHVLVPCLPSSNSQQALREWDLWGPFFFCLILAIILTEAAPQIFVIIWVGAAILTLNAVLLGGKISFFQSICILGYCVFPLLVGAIILLITTTFFGLYSLLFRLLISLVSYLWATSASMGFIGGLVPPQRKVLALYPLFLFYAVLAWLILVHFHEPQKN